MHLSANLMHSYSSESGGLSGRFREAISLYRLHSKDVFERVRSRIEDVQRVEARIQQEFGVDLHDLDVLEIGPGQFLTQLTYFALRNRVTGIDSDIVVQGFDFPGYARMLRHNGASRTIKTIARKLIGVDRRYASQLRANLGARRLPRVTVCAMDVRAMSFQSESFDFVYCRSVLQHLLPDPRAAMNDISRVLRPGGVAYISIHPYTSETGHLDPRIYSAQRRAEVAGWPHLRPQLRDSLYPANAPLNKLRLPDWRALLQETWPGARDIAVPSSDATRQAATALRDRGELLDSALDELLTGEFIALWQKPKVLSMPPDQANACVGAGSPRRALEACSASGLPSETQFHADLHDSGGTRCANLAESGAPESRTR